MSVPKKILIVEDDRMLCTIFNMFINELGYQLMGFSSDGEDALIQIKKEKPDVILMDIHLEGKLDGIETTKIIQKKYDIPIIFVSSDVEEQTIKNAILDNTYGFLVKPIYKDSLGVTIEFAYTKHLLDRKNRKK
ncbi:MAG: response regulator [Bacteroidales bacterium]|nr:response regulator [Bacteroidales bacterium]